MTRRDERTPLTGILRAPRHPAAIVAVGIAGVALVTAFGFLFARNPAITNADLAITAALNQLHVGVIGAVATAIYTVLSPAPAIVITVVIVALVWIVSRRLRVAAIFAFVVAVTWLPTAGLKLVVQRPRPDVHALAHPFATQPVDGSYPSGHAAFAVALVVAFVLLARDSAAHFPVIAGGALLIVVVAFALLIDGVHYPSDVLASVVWSLTLAPLVHLVARRLLARSSEIQESGR